MLITWPADGPAGHAAGKGAALRAIWQGLGRLLILPGEWVSNRLGVQQENNRDLIRMLINSLFWIMVAIVGLAIWTSTLAPYQ